MKWNWNRKWSWLLYGVAIAAGVYAGYVAWFAEDRMDLGAGFASANGRIEGVEIDVAAKTAGRVTAVLVDEGEFVKAGDVLARIDTPSSRLKCERLKRNSGRRRVRSPLHTVR
jgi:HlyD family secretion protein